MHTSVDLAGRTVAERVPNWLAGAEFAVVEEHLPPDVAEQYKQAADMWNQLRREFLYAAEKLEAGRHVAAARASALARLLGLPPALLPLHVHGRQGALHTLADYVDEPWHPTNDGAPVAMLTGRLRCARTVENGRLRSNAAAQLLGSTQRAFR